VHWWFYARRRADAARWKLQPARWLRPSLQRHAVILGGINLTFGSIIGGTFVWHALCGGWTALYFDARKLGLGWLILSALVTYFAVDAGLYYTHRLLHHPRLFRHIHRWHHRYVAPTVFTTTAMHPVEFFIFTFALLWPAFVIPMHVGVYVLVVAYTYFIGMVDHFGIRISLRLPFHSDNRFHDDHHIYFQCNYGHHTAVFDRLHETTREEKHVELPGVQ
jgi:lathosterol oxidase